MLTTFKGDITNPSPDVAVYLSWLARNESIHTVAPARDASISSKDLHDEDGTGNESSETGSGLLARAGDDDVGGVAGGNTRNAGAVGNGGDTGNGGSSGTAAGSARSGVASAGRARSTGSARSTGRARSTGGVGNVGNVDDLARSRDVGLGSRAAGTGARGVDSAVLTIAGLLLPALITSARLVAAVTVGADKVLAHSDLLNIAAVALAGDLPVAVTHAVVAVVALADDQLVPVIAVALLRAAASIAADNLVAGADGAVELRGAIVTIADDSDSSGDDDESVGQDSGDDITIAVGDSCSDDLGGEFAIGSPGDNSSVLNSSGVINSSGGINGIGADVDREENRSSNALATEHASNGTITTTGLRLFARATDVALVVRDLGGGIGINGPTTVTVPKCLISLIKCHGGYDYSLIVDTKEAAITLAGAELDAVQRGGRDQFKAGEAILGEDAAKVDKAIHVGGRAVARGVGATGRRGGISASTGRARGATSRVGGAGAIGREQGAGGRPAGSGDGGVVQRLGSGQVGHGQSGDGREKHLEGGTS